MITGKVSPLGFGFMRLPLSPGGGTEIDLERVKQMSDMFMASGMNYFDTAYMYHGGQSEAALREAVVKRFPRESFLAADKLPLWDVTSEADISRIFSTQLERTGLEYFDFYLIHCVCGDTYAKAERYGAFDFLRRMREEGKIRHMGFSFHDTPEFLEKVLGERGGDAEFVQLQINYFDWEDEVQSSRLYDIAREHGKPVIVMEPVKGGALANLPAEADRLFRGYYGGDRAASCAMRFCGSLEGIVTVLSGMSDMDQLRDNLDTFTDFRPLNAEERTLIGESVRILKQAELIPCTACRYCENCPQGIDIAGQFALYNRHRQSLDLSSAKAEFLRLGEGGAAESCVSCGKCEEHCPQGIKITDWLKKAVKKFK